MSNNGDQKKHPFAEHIQMLRDKINENREKIFGAAADGVDPDRYTELLFQAIGRKLDLGECTLSSLILALADSATLGLPINGLEAEGYIVPRKRNFKADGKWESVKEAHFQVGYLGKLKLAYESPRCAGITVHVVREGDDFLAELGSEQRIRHVPKWTSSAITHVYAVYWFKGGKRRCIAWSTEEIQEHARAYVDEESRNSDKGAWTKSWKAMAAKTVLRELLKYAPMRPEARRVLQAEEYRDAGVPVSTGLQSGDTAASDDLDALADAPMLAGDPDDRRFTDANAAAAHAKANEPTNGLPADPQTVMPEERKLRQESLL